MIEPYFKNWEKLKASISIHGSVLLILQKHCKTPLKRRLIIPILIQHFEAKTLQTSMVIKISHSNEYIAVLIQTIK